MFPSDGRIPTEGKLFILHSIGNVYESQGRDEAALSYFMDAKTESEHLTPNTHQDKAICYSNIGVIAYHWGHYELALRLFWKAMDIREKALGNRHIDVASTWNNAGCCLDCLHRIEEARYKFSLALEVLIPQLGLQHPRTAIVLRNQQKAKHRPMEVHMGAGPLGLRFRDDSKRWIPGGIFRVNAFEFKPALAPGKKKGGKKKKGKKGGKKKKK